MDNCTRPNDPGAAADASAHYISGTHWDREWYRPFEEYRILLVDIMDTVLDLLAEGGAFRYFHLDGQTCMIDDYLDIRPERRDQFEVMVRDGRILIGPWFTMPDLFGPGAESLVRNLLLGRRIASSWGASSMPVAYTCDMFGHPAQMPQIYAGFDLPYCILGRGTNEHTTPPFFEWHAPDGSRVLCFKLQDSGGYGAFAAVRHFVEQPSFDPRDQRESRARDALGGYIEHEMKRTTCGVLCLMDAMDHTPPATDVATYLRMLRETAPQIHARHSTLPAFFQEAAKRLGAAPTRHGELREPARERHGYLHLLANCVSARVSMKQANDACQVLLERWVEPWAAMAAAAGHEDARGFRDTAWRELLLCHAHDSICGCSIDQVFRDIMNRYERVQVIGEQLRNRALAALTAGTQRLSKDPRDITVTVANPLPVARHEVVEFDVDLPQDWPGRFHEGYLPSPEIMAFDVHDGDGAPVACQLLAQTENVVERTRYAKPATHSDGPVVRCRVAAELNLPALGFTALRVSPSRKPMRRFGTLRTGPAGADNGYIGFAVNANGTINLTDHDTGTTYRDLLMFRDSSETGDAWRHAGLVSDEQILSTTGEAQTALVEDGPEQTAFLVTLFMRIPEAYDSNRRRRAESHAILQIRNRLTLRRGARQIEVETTVANTVRDHRLQLLMPTDRGTDTWLAHGPYDVVERSIPRSAETEQWSEADLIEKPFLDFQAVSDGTSGLAFLSAGGLHEGGVDNDPRRTMQVTLLRAFSHTVATSGEDGPQEQGTLAFRYALRPFAGELDAVDIMLAAHALQAGVWTRQDGCLASGYPPMQGTLEPRQTYLEQHERSLVVMAVKQPEEGSGLIVRLWNPAPDGRIETLRFAAPLADVAWLKLSEEPIDRLESKTDRVEHQANMLRVTVRGHGIATIRVRFHNQPQIQRT